MIAPCPAELLEAGDDGCARLRGTDGECATLIRVDERGQRVELTLIERTGRGVPERLDSGECLCMGLGVGHRSNHGGPLCPPARPQVPTAVRPSVSPDLPAGLSERPRA